MSLHGFQHKLSWSKDFTTRNEPPLGQEHLVAYTVATASTVGEVKAVHDREKDIYSLKSSSIKVQIKMVKSQSWVLKHAKSDKLLRHEQLHYNISALGGRDYERELKKLTAKSVSELVAKRDQLNEQIQALIDDINDEYDNRILWGTDHGRLEMHQEFWEMHISKLMNNKDGRLESIYAMMRR
jgi:hypothetical protein